MMYIYALILPIGRWLSNKMHRKFLPTETALAINVVINWAMPYGGLLVWLSF